jgi:eukaryotic-like serine/threonine-protein kinase
MSDPLGELRPRPGMRIGRYHLQGRIGAGGMAEVFLARQEGPAGFTRRVAIKFVHPDREDPELLRSLIDEARVSALLQHPGIVQVIELDSFGDGFYLVMEYLEGLPLDRLVRLSRSKEQAAGLPAIVDLGSQLLDALAYAHGALGEGGTPLRVVHRDVKPSNVIVDGLGLAKLVDFGIARAEPFERRTATGIGKGTPAYMAPEQLRGEAVGGTTDLYAVGVVLTELALGRQLFTADNFMALITRRTQGFTEQDRADLAAVHPELVPVLERALAEPPEERWPDAAAMAEALRELAPDRPRRPLVAWMTRVLGDDPAALFATAASAGATPTRIASAGERLVAPDERGGTRVVGQKWMDEGSAADGRTGGVGDDGGVGPTRLVPREPAGGLVERGRLAAMAGLLVFLGAVAVVLWRPWAEPADDRAPRNPDQHLQVTVEVTPTPAPSTPEPEATPASTTPTTVNDDPTPDPSPRSTPDAVATLPTPAPTVTATPAPTPSPTPDAAATARGALAVSLLPSGGTVEVEGHGRRPSPTGEMRLPPGTHAVRLFDGHGGLLGSVSVEVRSGETSRCAWIQSEGGLSLVPDPEGDPCRLR